MKKKTLFLIILGLLIVVLAGGVFWWWQDQSEVKELNKNLPKGVRVVKSLFGKEYKVINEIDGYELKIPKEWGGLAKIEYFEEEKNRTTGLSLEGLRGKEKELGVICYKLNQENISLEDWVKELFRKFKLSDLIKIEKKKIGDFEVVQVRAEEQFKGFVWNFFKKNLKIYEIDGISNELLREIILNGKW